MITSLKIALLVAVVMAVGSSVFGQNTIFNKKEYLGYGSHCRTVFVEEDRYVTLGIKVDSVLSKYCLLFCSFDLDGNLQYKKTYCDTTNNYSINASQSASAIESGFLYAASISDTVPDTIPDGADYLLVKYNAIGDTVFTKRYNYFNLFNDGRACVQTNDSGYLFCGYTEIQADLHVTCGQLVKTDSLGNVEWTQNYNCNFFSFLTKIINTDDGGYCLAGDIQPNNQFNYNQMQVIKVDNNGNQQWIKYFGGPKDEYSPAISKLADGNILVTGMYTTEQNGPSEQYFNILYILKIDVNTGDTIWTKKYGEEGNIILPFFNYENSDGSLIVGGMTYGWIDQSIFDSREMGFLTKLSADGDSLWFKKYYIDTANVAFAEFTSGKPTPDGGAVICGRATNYGISGSDTWLLKTDANGCIDLSCVNGVEELDDEDFRLFIYPNPAAEYVSIDLPISYNKGTMQIYNLQGQLVKSENITGGGLQSVNISEIPHGVYNLVVYSAANNLLGREKLVVVK